MLAITNLVSAQLIPLQRTYDCGMWLEARNKNNAASLESFIVGLVNGLSIGATMNIWNGKGVAVSQAQLHYWMDEYCKKNPLSGIYEGAHVFADEMTNGKFSKQIKK